MELKRLLPFTFVLLWSCQKDQWDDCITSTGPMRTEVRSVGFFDRIDLNDRVDLVLEQGDGSIRVEAGRNLLGQVVTEVRDGVLYVSNENRCNWVRSFKPRITVHVPAGSLHEVTLRGTGNVSGTTTIQRPVFSIQQQGGLGSVRLHMEVDTCRIGFHAGAGDVVCSGTAAYADLYLASMGRMDLRSLAAARVWAFNNGSGDILCRPEQRLDAIIRYVGDVRYTGSPATITSDITGSGALIHDP
ncbi:MAG TPA: head GIN domain-containing protein [Flavobacteriales bacterium]